MTRKAIEMANRSTTVRALRLCLERNLPPRKNAGLLSGLLALVEIARGGYGKC